MGKVMNESAMKQSAIEYHFASVGKMIKQAGFGLVFCWFGAFGVWFTDLEARLPNRSFWFTKGGNWSRSEWYR